MDPPARSGEKSIESKGKLKMSTVAIYGAAGRMGRRLVALAIEDENLTLAGAVDRPDHDLIGQDAGLIAGAGKAGVAITGKLDKKVDALIDFTAPAATRIALQSCVETGSGMVIGTTGLTDEDHALIDEAAKKIAILQAPNMSLGVNLLFALVGQVATRLGDDYDIEITEAHHRFKQDAPSGTALGLAESICEATGKSMSDDLVHGRVGEAPRTRGEIGMHALRYGDEVGDHTVTFGTLGEQIRIGHRATTRDVFARGALRAGHWLAGKPAGRYKMKDVLGL